jgi:hypothetical protein
LILEDRRSDFLRGLPEDAIQDKILVGWSVGNWRENFAWQGASLSEKVAVILFG